MGPLVILDDCIGKILPFIVCGRSERSLESAKTKIATIRAVARRQAQTVSIQSAVFGTQAHFILETTSLHLFPLSYHVPSAPDDWLSSHYAHMDADISIHETCGVHAQRLRLCPRTTSPAYRALCDTSFGQVHAIGLANNGQITFGSHNMRDTSSYSSICMFRSIRGPGKQGSFAENARRPPALDRVPCKHATTPED